MGSKPRPRSTGMPSATCGSTSGRSGQCSPGISSNAQASKLARWCSGICSAVAPPPQSTGSARRGLGTRRLISRTPGSQGCCLCFAAAASRWRRSATRCARCAASPTRSSSSFAATPESPGNSYPRDTTSRAQYRRRGGLRVANSHGATASVREDRPEVFMFTPFQKVMLALVAVGFVGVGLVTWATGASHSASSAIAQPVQPAPVFSQSAPPPGIVATGEASVRADSSEGYLAFAVQIGGPVGTDVAGQLQARVERVLAKARALGVQDADIVLGPLQFQPQFTYDPSKA